MKEMRPKLHELEKTSIELRRAILRLQNLAEIDPKEFADSRAMNVLDLLKQAKHAIPEQFQDPDVLGG